MTFHGIYMVSRGINLLLISVCTSGPHWNVACSVAKVSPVRGGAGRALCEERLLSGSLCGDLIKFRCKRLVLWTRDIS